MRNSHLISPLAPVLLLTMGITRWLSHSICQNLACSKLKIWRHPESNDSSSPSLPDRHPHSQDNQQPALDWDQVSWLMKFLIPWKANFAGCCRRSSKPPFTSCTWEGDSDHQHRTGENVQENHIAEATSFTKVHFFVHALLNASGQFKSRGVGTLVTMKAKVLRGTFGIPTPNHQSQLPRDVDSLNLFPHYPSLLAKTQGT